MESELERMLARGGAPPGPPQMTMMPGHRVVVHESSQFGFGGIDLFPGALNNPTWNRELDRVLLLDLFDTLGSTLHLVRFERTGLIRLIESALALADDFTLDAVAEAIEARREVLDAPKVEGPPAAEPEQDGESKIAMPR